MKVVTSVSLPYETIAPVKQFCETYKIPFSTLLHYCFDQLPELNDAFATAMYQYNPREESTRKGGTAAV